MFLLQRANRPLFKEISNITEEGFVYYVSRCARPRQHY